MFIGFNSGILSLCTSAGSGRDAAQDIHVSGCGLGLDGLNMDVHYRRLCISASAFWLSIINLFSRAFVVGEVAGKNPWNADSLEWEDRLSASGVRHRSHTGPSSSRHPLWDDHDEEYDPVQRARPGPKGVSHCLPHGSMRYRNPS